MGLSNDLSALIEAYADKKGQSLTTLSKESGVPYGSVKRIAQGESIPELYNTLKLLMVLSPKASDCFSFIQKHYQDVGDFLSRVNYEPASKNLSDALSDKVSFYIIQMATTNGITRQEVVEEFGRNGLATLDTLLEKGVLREVNQKIIADDFSVVDIHTTLKQIEFLIEDFDVNKLGNKQSLASLQVVRVDQDGADKIYQAQKRFIEDVLSIREKNLSQGSKVMFVATLYNSLGKS